MSFISEELHRVMTVLNQNHFQVPEIMFLREWAQIMSTVARALDIIQGEETGFLGCLLPTVVATKIKLISAKGRHPVHCNPLIDALLAGIDKRFGNLLEDLDCQLAAAFHPRFRLKWLQIYESQPGSDPSKLARVRNAMQDAVESAFMADISAEGSDGGGVGGGVSGGVGGGIGGGVGGGVGGGIGGGVGGGVGGGSGGGGGREEDITADDGCGDFFAEFDETVTPADSFRRYSTMVVPVLLFIVFTLFKKPCSFFHFFCLLS
jgi:hypothetical protein